jgi:hypothetical protein
LLVNVTGAVTVSQIQVPRYKIKAVRVSTKITLKMPYPQVFQQQAENWRQIPA